MGGGGRPSAFLRWILFPHNWPQMTRIEIIRKIVCLLLPVNKGIRLKLGEQRSIVKKNSLCRYHFCAMLSFQHSILRYPILFHYAFHLQIHSGLTKQLDDLIGR